MGTQMTTFIFPITVAGLLFVGWVVMVAFDSCVLQRNDPKFDCWSSVQLAAVFAAIGSLLTGLVALAARAMLDSFLPFFTRAPELKAALVASAVLVLVSYSVIRWEINFGHIGIQLFGWLGVSFGVCSGALLLVKFLSK